MKPPKSPIALEERSQSGARLFSPSAARNREPIRDALLLYMPRSGVILEIGSGSGEHVVCLARALPGATFLPGDPDAASRASISAWTAHAGLTNVAPPHAIDVTSGDWPKSVAGPCDAILSINMIHIAPFAAARGLIEGAGELLLPDGKLFLYGPFSRHGVHTAESNAAFDADLKQRNSEWGVRDLEREILPLATRSGFRLEAVLPMPANNHSAIFTKASSAGPPGR